MSQFGKRLIKGLEEAVAVAKGRARPAKIYGDVDAAKIRAKLRLSQSEFADLLDVSGRVVRSRIEIRLPLSIKRAAERLARAEGVSLNRWIASAVARKVGGTEQAAVFFKRRAEGGSRRDLIAVLAKAKDRKPDPRDRR